MHTFYFVESSPDALFKELNDDNSFIHVTLNEKEAIEYLQLPPVLEGQKAFKVTIEEIAVTPSIL